MKFIYILTSNIEFHAVHRLGSFFVHRFSHSSHSQTILRSTFHVPRETFINFSEYIPYNVQAFVHLAFVRKSILISIYPNTNQPIKHTHKHTPINTDYVWSPSLFTTLLAFYKYFHPKRESRIEEHHAHCDVDMTE